MLKDDAHLRVAIQRPRAYNPSNKDLKALLDEISLQLQFISNGASSPSPFANEMVSLVKLLTSQVAFLNMHISTLVATPPPVTASLEHNLFKCGDVIGEVPPTNIANPNPNPNPNPNRWVPLL